MKKLLLTAIFAIFAPLLVFGEQTVTFIANFEGLNEDSLGTYKATLSARDGYGLAGTVYLNPNGKAEISINNFTHNFSGTLTLTIKDLNNQVLGILTPKGQKKESMLFHISYVYNVTPTTLYLYANGKIAEAGNTQQKIKIGKMVKNPVIAPPEQVKAYSEKTLSVSITCATEGVTIWYTIDGTMPSSTQGDSYDPEKPFILIPTAKRRIFTVRAIAVKDGWTDSEVVKSTYAFK
ncbi:MAG: chitobiase/beta-hexosaminidase C-terminal domain-containing protein [Spirochaetales bacterium]|nr:chitobiase/beta-hexosaminidase C-terminal domain-containing protein [Spirochaetales bacterium]